MPDLVDNALPPAAPVDSCCDPGSGGSAGETPRVDDSALLPAWVPSCTGGGTVPLAADAAYSEDWDLL